MLVYAYFRQDLKTFPVQYASVDKNSGANIISKNFVSPAGTKTEYYYESSLDGLEVINYKITDKNGKILMDREQTFQKTDENNFVSSMNGKVYKINFDGAKITIEDNSSNKKNVIDLTGKIPENGRDTVLNILKRVPGNQLLMMTKLPIEKIEYDAFSLANNNAYWSGEDKTIFLSFHQSSSDFTQSLFTTFMHEYGHFLDCDPATGECETVSKNQELIKIYNKELQDFLDDTTTLQQDYIRYFIYENGFYNPSEERAAETNMLLYTNPNDYLSVRALYYQQYFPQTIAKIAELFEQLER